jgi:hypothetical protein
MSLPERMCKRCSASRPLTDFRKLNNPKAGRPQHRTRECNVCYKKAQQDIKKARLSAGPPPDLCELCGLVEPAHLDHCHVTGRFRGWLCRNCNTALGGLGDNREGLLRALAYLERAERA